MWFEIYVQDMPRAVAFYQQVLATTLSELVAPEGDASGFHMMAFPGSEGEAGAGASGALVRAEGCPSGGNGTMVYFACADCAVEAGRVEAAGGRILKDKFSIGPYGFCAIAMDPDGNAFGLHSMQ